MRRVDFPARGSCHKGGQGGAHNHQSRRQTADGGCRRAMTVLCARRRRSRRSFPFSAHLLLQTIRLISHGRSATPRCPRMRVVLMHLKWSEPPKSFPTQRKYGRNKSNRQSLLRKKIVNEQAVIDGMDSLACARVPPANSAGIYLWPLMRQ